MLNADMDFDDDPVAEELSLFLARTKMPIRPTQPPKVMKMAASKRIPLGAADVSVYRYTGPKSNVRKCEDERFMQPLSKRRHEEVIKWPGKLPDSKCEYAPWLWQEYDKSSIGNVKSFLNTLTLKRTNTTPQFKSTVLYTSTVTFISRTGAEVAYTSTGHSHKEAEKNALEKAMDKAAEWL